MPELKNQNREKFCQNLVKYNFNGAKAYLDAYPNTKSINASRVEACRLKKVKEIHERVIEILDQNGMSIDKVIAGFKDDLTAERPIVVGNKVKFVRDNSNISNARQFILKGLGFGSGGEVQPESINNNFNISLSDNNIEKLYVITESLKKMNDDFGIEQDGEIIDCQENPSDSVSTSGDGGGGSD